MFSKTLVGMAVAGACFVGYCIYFDHKRRSDPDFKKKLKAKRRKAKQQSKSSTTTSKLPDIRDPEAMQRFFLQEVQLGEELLAGGNIEEGIEHLGSAVAVCGTPHQLLQVLQQTLAPSVYQVLVERLPSIRQRVMNSAAAAGPASLLEDDVE